MSLRYRAVVAAVRSLRGRTAGATVAPSTAAVRYRAGRRRGIAPLADVYLPSPALATGASVVLVHGGGFVIGSRTMKPMRMLASRLVAAGVATCAIDYRLIFRGGRLDEALEDVEASLDFWSAQVGELGLDPRAISLAGLSAGATLALLAAGQRRADELHRLVCCFGMYEVDHLRGPARLLPRLMFRSDDAATWVARSPRHAAQPTIPTLLLHGSDDGLVPVAQAHRLAHHRAALGLPTTLVVYDGAPHGFFNLPSEAAEAGVHALIAHVTSG